ncbi:hypothetical protein pqer_cds_269 [Pandoravirus quercus]|uniref:Endopeptidase incomplete domain containing protein n=2 Tax=Pandoravirus TaxID=2060084 RepID=A0A2U7U8C3_9VIRU|nr:hypothetical protein pqer_cds_269 [Pandoravirus quercus]AVK74691.1 hypothetical protein pqer_cds_269 [Pandoravirus quercus]QBZ80868.1 hypothetical protein pclt_cds_270 [Pandoravirus celtis]
MTDGKQQDSNGRGRRRVILYVAIALLVGLVVAAWCAARTRRYVTATPEPLAQQIRLAAYPFRTGDLVLTSNRNGRDGRGLRSLVDWATPIKWITGSPFHHAAVVYVEPDTRQVLFWEINGNGTRLATVRDLTSGRPDHDVFVRSLSAPVDDALFERAMAVQWEHEFNFFAPAAVAARFLGRPCRDFSTSSLVDREVALRGTTDPRAAPKRTCAHMVAELYHLVGVFDYAGGRRGIDPAAVCAGDFARPTIDRRVLPLAADYRFGPLVHLGW